MVSRSPRQSPFILLPVGWMNIRGVAQLPAASVVLLIGLVEHCQLRRNGGRMTVEAVRMVARSRLRGVCAIEPLVDEGILRLVGPTRRQGVESLSCKCRESADSVSTVCRECADYVLTACREWNINEQRDPSISPAQPESLRESSADMPDRAPARVRKKEREERTPSGSVRSSKARAAPRDAEGAAQHTPRNGDSPAADDGDTLNEPTEKMTRREAIAASRKAVDESTMRTAGRPAQLRRYPVELHKLSDPLPPVELNGHHR